MDADKAIQVLAEQCDIHDIHRSVAEFFRFLWENYALEDDEVLTEDAKELKQALLTVFRREVSQ
jgi:hypothetical protein